MERPMHNAETMLDETGPGLFIFSCERSGSTLLRYIIDTHPHIACPAHLYLGRLCQDLYYTLESSLGHTLSDYSEEQQEAALLAQVRAVVNCIMTRYTAAKRKAIWCEKTPMNLEHRGVLAKVFPAARYICLYRHCLDVVHSCIGLRNYRYLPEHIPYVRHRPDNLVAAMLSNWIDKIGSLLDWEKRHSRNTLRICYESLVQDTTPTLASLFAFLELDWDESLTTQIFRQKHDAGEGDAKVQFSRSISAQSVGKGVGVPHELIPSDLEEQANALLAELGYPSIAQFYAENALRNSATEIKATIIADELFRRLYVEKADRIRAIPPSYLHPCKFVVTGNSGGTWIIDPAEPQLISQGREACASTTIVLANDLLLDLVEGRKNPLEAYEEGKLQVIGDLDVAFEFGRALFA